MEKVNLFLTEFGEHLKPTLSDSEVHYTRKNRVIEESIMQFFIEQNIGYADANRLKGELEEACKALTMSADINKLDLFFNVKKAGTFLDINYKLGRYSNKMSLPCERRFLELFVDRIRDVLDNPNSLEVRAWNAERGTYNSLSKTIVL